MHGMIHRACLTTFPRRAPDMLRQIPSGREKDSVREFQGSLGGNLLTVRVKRGTLESLRKQVQGGAKDIADVPLPRFIFCLMYDGRHCNSGGRIVALMQTAEPWHRYDLIYPHRTC